MTFHRSSRYSRRALVPRVASLHHPLMLLLRVQSMPQAVLSRPASDVLSHGYPLVSSTVAVPSRPSHEVSYPSTTSNWGSDLHRAFHARLCCVLRVSHPLDALFRPYSPGLVSCQCRPGFGLQRLSLPDSLQCLATLSAPLAVSQRFLSVPPPRLQGFVHSGSPYHPGRYYPVPKGRSSPDLYPFEVFLSRSRRPCGCLLSWAFARR